MEHSARRALSPAGPLVGLKVLEIAGIGPSTFAAMLLADLGAEVLRVDRAAWVGRQDRESDFLVTRGRSSVAIDLKVEGGSEVVLRLVEQADVLIEGFRPGVAERLGFGPKTCHDRNPRLVYVRCTGWGQEGPYAQVPGHDINYIAVTGALAAIGRSEGRPAVPLNLLGDYGGGGMLAAIGVLAGLYEVQRSGHGQVVDAAMVDGVALLTTLIHGMRSLDRWRDEREANATDGGAPFYDVYETSDGHYVAIGAGEPQFFDHLLKVLGLEAEFDVAAQMETTAWPRLRARIADRVAERTRDEWAALAGDPDLCLTPVLTWGEVGQDRHNRVRETYVEHDGVVQPAPAPRFERTPGAIRRGLAEPGEHSEVALVAWGFSPDEVSALLDAKVVHQAS